VTSSTENRPKTVLVTGAMGQVGRLLVGLLLEQGRTVIGVDLPSPAAQGVAGRFATGPGWLVPKFVDITDASALGRAVEAHGPEAIVHLAAVVSPPCYRNPGLAHRVNVFGTRNLVQAAQPMAPQPMFINASSASVYGSRNPYRHRERIDPITPAKPVDCYGHDKVMAEQIVAGSGLRHATLRLAGVASPDAPTGPDYLVLGRAIPNDNRVHMVDARDVALAFANATDRIDTVDGKTLLIGGNESYVLRHSTVQDDIFDAFGLGRVGPDINLPGDPDDDEGWSFTDWFDTTESQQLLDYQKHNWSDTLAWIRATQGRRRLVIRAASPLVRPLLRAGSRLQRRRDRRGRYADPWTLIRQIYGDEAFLAAPPEPDAASP
jgi:nucleoside-diphosphate-sugar epimerase